MNAAVRAYSEKTRRRLTINLALAGFSEDKDANKLLQDEKRESKAASSSGRGEAPSAPLPPARSQQLAQSSLQRLHPTAMFLASRGRDRGRGGAASYWRKQLGWPEPGEPGAGVTAEGPPAKNGTRSAPNDDSGMAHPVASRSGARDDQHALSPAACLPPGAAAEAQPQEGPPPGATRRAQPQPQPQPRLQPQPPPPLPAAAAAADPSQDRRSLSLTLLGLLAQAIGRMQPLLDGASSGTGSAAASEVPGAAAAPSAASASAAAAAAAAASPLEREEQSFRTLRAMLQKELHQYADSLLLDEAKRKSWLRLAVPNLMCLTDSMHQLAEMHAENVALMFEEAAGVRCAWERVVMCQAAPEELLREVVLRMSGRGAAAVEGVSFAALMEMLVARFPEEQRIRWLRLAQAWQRGEAGADLVAGQALCGMLLMALASHPVFPPHLEPLTCAAMCGCYVVIQEAASEAPASPIHLYDTLRMGPMPSDLALPYEAPEPARFSQLHLLGTVTAVVGRPLEWLTWLRMMHEARRGALKAGLQPWPLLITTAQLLPVLEPEVAKAVLAGSERGQQQQQQEGQPRAEAGPSALPTASAHAGGWMGDAWSSETQQQLSGEEAALADAIATAIRDIDSGRSDEALKREQYFMNIGDYVVEALWRMDALPELPPAAAATAPDQPHDLQRSHMLSINLPLADLAAVLLTGVAALSYHNVSFQTSFRDTGKGGGDQASTSQAAAEAAEAAACAGGLKGVAFLHCNRPAKNGPGYKWSKIKANIACMTASNNAQQQTKLVRDAMVKKRLRFMWVQGRGVEGIWRALTAITQVRQEMLAAGRDLCFSVCDVVSYGDRPAQPASAGAKGLMTSAAAELRAAMTLVAEEQPPTAAKEEITAQWDAAVLMVQRMLLLLGAGGGSSGGGSSASGNGEGSGEGSVRQELHLEFALLECVKGQPWVSVAEGVEQVQVQQQQVQRRKQAAELTKVMMGKG